MSTNNSMSSVSTLLCNFICPQLKKCPLQLRIATFPEFEQKNRLPSHATGKLSLILRYLKQAASSARRGLNIFIHGAPGTEKSELARVLAKELGTELFQVASEDADGDAIGGEPRLCTYRAVDDCPELTH